MTYHETLIRDMNEEQAKEILAKLLKVANKQADQKVSLDTILTLIEQQA